MSWPPPENDNDSKEVKVRTGQFFAGILTSTVSCSCVSPNTSPSSNIEANRIIQNLININTEVCGTVVLMNFAIVVSENNYLYYKSNLKAANILILNIRDIRLSIERSTYS